MNESTSRLLEAVDLLTKPVIEHHRQTDDDGRFLGVHTVEHPPLLEQLRAAVTPNGADADGSSSKSLLATRNLIDADALHLWGVIVGAVRSWCWQAELVPAQHDPVTDLRAWYVKVTQYAEDLDWHVSELRKWAGKIRNQIDPPKRIQIVVPCPVCASDFWADEEGQTMRHPLVIEYRMSEGGQVVRPRAMCRNGECGAVWDSFASVEELAAELQDKHLAPAGVGGM